MMTALELFLSRLVPGGRVLHIGGGASDEREQLMAHSGKLVEVDFARTGRRWNEMAPMLASESFDGLFASHVLEHMRNPGKALDEMFRVLKPGALLGIVVPPLKHDIVGGHVTLWNAGLLCYQLILAGFDLSEAAVRAYEYNIAIVTEKRAAEYDRSKLVYDHGDITLLAPFFPAPFTESTDGRMDTVRWQ